VFYGTYSYGGVKSILAKALDLEPLPLVLTPSADEPTRYRFARSAEELLANTREAGDEPH